MHIAFSLDSFGEMENFIDSLLVAL
jgi:hypothetical protein